MQYIVKLANDFPLIMAPASLIAAVAILSLVIIIYRSLRLKILMMASVLLALIVWAMMMQIIIK